MSEIIRLDNEIVKPSVEKIGIRGHFKSYVTDGKGRKYQKQEGENYLYDSFFEAISKHLTSNFDLKFDNLFSGSELAPNAGDGIVLGIYNTPLIEEYWSMVSVVTQTATQFIVTGTYTNSTGASQDFTNPLLGNAWYFVPAISFIPLWLEFWVAHFTGFTLTTVPNGEVLTITWTINFTAH